ncbi:hypothetical protein BYT27DRAFT_7334614 [Phlegmacium glaucopus]|nr:hypothetical protein BYT27DRAFT_7334614 [Phlegmacium glaucopus]
MVVGESGLGKTTLISTLFSELVTCEKLQQASFLPLCQRWLQQQILTNFEKLDERIGAIYVVRIPWTLGQKVYEWRVTSTPDRDNGPDSPNLQYHAALLLYPLYWLAGRFRATLLFRK